MSQPFTRGTKVTYPKVRQANHCTATLGVLCVHAHKGLSLMEKKRLKDSYSGQDKKILVLGMEDKDK